MVTGSEIGVDVTCAGCGGQAAAGDRCPDCGRLQPFPAEADHWAILGLPRCLVLTREDLDRRVHELNRRFHPDFYRLRSPEEQAQSLENSAAVNTAARVLRDPVTRTEYVLAREGMALGGAGTRPPADLFEEIMEVQEARQELAMASADEAVALRERLRSAQAELQGRRAAAAAMLPALFARWDAAPADERRGVLTEMRDLLGRRAYLRTVLRDLATTLDGLDGLDGGESIEERAEA